VSETPEVIGLVAGSGRLPTLVAQAVREAGAQVAIIAHEGESDPALEAEADFFRWVKLGQLGRVRAALQEAGVRRATMAGGVKKVRFFRDARPDAAALKVIARVVTSRGDDKLLRVIASYFEEAGIEIVGATELAPGLLAGEGVWGRHRPSKGQRQDIEVGARLLEAMGPLDIGQAVVVKDQVVLAVEAAEGTDACVERGGALGGGDVVVVKRPKPGQDLRFDLPAVGPGTVETLARAGGGVLAVEAGRTIVLEREALIAAADRLGIAVVGVAPPAPAPEAP